MKEKCRGRILVLLAKKKKETEEDLWDAVIKAYDGDIDRVVENARLLWLRRYEGEIWQPPDKR